MTPEQRIAVWAASTSWLATLYRTPNAWKYVDGIIAMQRAVGIALHAWAPMHVARSPYSPLGTDPYGRPVQPSIMDSPTYRRIRPVLGAMLEGAGPKGTGSET